MRIRELAERVRHSLWFIPALAVVIAVVVALGMLALSDRLDASGAHLPLIFGAGPDGARAMLGAIGGSVITVAGTIFSITIVALQLTSSQFSPRVLRNFLRDRPNQLVLGVFIGTFTYCLLVLRSIRAEATDRAAFVPNVAVTGALLLAFLSIGMLIYFIHHVSVRIQVTSILASVASDTLHTIETVADWLEDRPERAWRSAGSLDRVPAAPPTGAIPADRAQVRIVAHHSGYLQFLDIGRLVRAAAEADGRLEVLVAPGGWVQRDAPVATFAGPDDADTERLGDAVNGALSLAAERSTQQDVAFGIQQIVDIGAKALSPGVNDPTTAINALDRLLQILVAAGVAQDPPQAFADADGVTRLDVPMPGLHELVELALDQLRHYGASTPAVALHMARVLSQLRDALGERAAPAIRRQADLLVEAAARIPLASERAAIMAAVAPLRSA